MGATYGIMRIEKRKSGDVYGVAREALRTEDQKGETFNGSDIDWDRTGQNVLLIQPRRKSVKREVTREIADAGLKARRDSTVMVDALFTASPQWYDGKSRDEVMKYFDECLDFYVKDVCGGDRQRVLYAVVHFDEKTPHMHVASVPIIEDEKGKHLSAKIVLGGRSDFRKRQDRFYEDVSRRWGLDRGEVYEYKKVKDSRGKTRQVRPEAMKKHVTTMQLKAATLQEQIARDDAAVGRGQKDAEAVQADISTLQAQKCVLEAVDAAMRTDTGALGQGLILKRDPVEVSDGFMKKKSVIQLSPQEYDKLYTGYRTAYAMDAATKAGFQEILQGTPSLAYMSQELYAARQERDKAIEQTRRLQGQLDAVEALRPEALESSLENHLRGLVQAFRDATYDSYTGKSIGFDYSRLDGQGQPRKTSQRSAAWDYMDLCIKSGIQPAEDVADWAMKHGYIFVESRDTDRTRDGMIHKKIDFSR